MNTKDNITISSEQIEQFIKDDNDAKEKAKELLSNAAIKESALQVVFNLLQITTSHSIKPEMFESIETYKDFIFKCIVEPYSFDINKQNEVKSWYKSNNKSRSKCSRSRSSNTIFIFSSIFWL